MREVLQHNSDRLRASSHSLLTLEVDLRPVQGLRLTIKLLGEEAVSTMVDSQVTSKRDEASANGEVPPMSTIEIGAGEPFTYEMALEIHKQIRRIGLGNAYVPPLEPEAQTS